MTVYTFIIVCCWVIFILYWAVSSFGVKRDITRTPWWRAWWFRIILIAMIASSVSYSVARGHFAIHGILPQTIANPLLASVGVALTIAGIALAIWARVYLGRNWSPAPALKEDHELVTSGPYQLIRHPIYTGIIMAALGSVLVNISWFLIPIIACVVFVWRVRLEENLMTRQFPDQYPAYKKRTWALIPFVY